MRVDLTWNRCSDGKTQITCTRFPFRHLNSLQHTSTSGRLAGRRATTNKSRRNRYRDGWNDAARRLVDYPTSRSDVGLAIGSTRGRVRARAEERGEAGLAGGGAGVGRTTGDHRQRGQVSGDSSGHKCCPLRRPPPSHRPAVPPPSQTVSPVTVSPTDNNTCPDIHSTPSPQPSPRPAPRPSPQPSPRPSPRPCEPAAGASKSGKPTPFFLSSPLNHITPCRRPRRAEIQPITRKP